MGILYIVATPIGNLQDVTERAIATLRAVDGIYCEDTRVTRILIDHLGISKPLFAYHQHSREGVTGDIARKLAEGMSLALVSDAGTPGINDPGGQLIAHLLHTMPDLRIMPVPGPNAAVAALSASGFPADRYRYWGFIPQKKRRRTFFAELAMCNETVVFYESKHRILKTLQSLADAMPERPMLLARELTKKFETLYRGTAPEVLMMLRKDATLGEFVIVMGPHA
jgi:16S rRNA (cytidine1402-2'-O)-methyltransferase